LPIDNQNGLKATHIAIQEWLDGKPVEWMEQVSDEQYQVPKVNK
jgi:hypothetical protein